MEVQIGFNPPMDFASMPSLRRLRLEGMHSGTPTIEACLEPLLWDAELAGNFTVQYIGSDIIALDRLLSAYIWLVDGGREASSMKGYRCWRDCQPTRPSTFL